MVIEVKRTVLRRDTPGMPSLTYLNYRLRKSQTTAPQRGVRRNRVLVPGSAPRSIPRGRFPHHVTQCRDPYQGSRDVAEFCCCLDNLGLSRIPAG